MTAELSEQKLNFGIWLADHKLLFKKIFIISFIVVDTLLIGYAIYGAVKYYIIDWEKHQRLAQSLTQSIDFKAYHEYNQPEELQVLQSDVIIRNVVGETSGSKVLKRDYAAKIRNGNKKWSATFDYRFSEGAEYQKGFILPEENKYLIQANIDKVAGTGQDRLEIKDLRWKKNNAHKIPDYSVYKEERLKFEISDIEFKNSNDLGIKDLSELSFNVANMSVYNFRFLDLKVILSQGSKVVGVNSFLVENFLSEQEEEVKMNLLGYLPASAKIEIEPQVNILDENVFLGFESIPGERK